MSRKSKITRNNLFYSESDFLFDLEIGENYIKQDINQTIVLFKVDRDRTVTDRWGETTTKGVVYKEPIELNALYTIDAVKNKAHDTTQNLGHFQQLGNLTIHIYIKTLKDNNTDISFGDYIGVQVTPEQMEYFVVTKDGRADFDNTHTLFGMFPLYKTIICTPADKKEFKGV